MKILKLSRLSFPATSPTPSLLKDPREVDLAPDQVIKELARSKSVSSSAQQELHAERLAMIKKRVENGTYQVSSELIADAISKKLIFKQ